MRVNLTTSHGSWRVDEPKDGLYSDEFSNVDCSSFAKNRIKSRDSRNSFQHTRLKTECNSKRHGYRKRLTCGKAVVDFHGYDTAYRNPKLTYHQCIFEKPNTHQTSAPRELISLRLVRGRLCSPRD